MKRDPIIERGGYNLYGIVYNALIFKVDLKGLTQACYMCCCPQKITATRDITASPHTHIVNGKLRLPFKVKFKSSAGYSSKQLSNTNCEIRWSENWLRASISDSRVGAGWLSPTTYSMSALSEKTISDSPAVPLSVNPAFFDLDIKIEFERAPGCPCGSQNILIHKIKIRLYYDSSTSPVTNNTTSSGF